MILAAFVQSVALAGGTVHTMVEGAKPFVGTVLIEADRIRAVGAEVPVPEGATRVDASGLHVIPGLVDGLVNHDPDHDRLYVAAGVTLVRDVGNDLAHVITERDRERTSGARDRGPGPAIWTAGAVIDGARPATTAAIVIASVEEAEQKLPRYFDLGPDFVSPHAGISQSCWRKVIEMSHARGLQVCGPLPRGSTLAEALAAGQDGLFHLEAFLPAGSAWDGVKIEDLLPRVEKAAAAKLAVTPTLGVFAARLVRPSERAPELAYLGPMYVTAWVADAGLRREVITEEFLRTGLRVVDLQGRVARELHERGARIVPGSGSPNPWLFPGDALASELKLLARAGLPPSTVLALATRGAAAAIGAGGDRGTIEAGKIADLVLLRGDPEADLGNLRDPETVVLRGRVLDRATLERLRQDLSATQKRLQAAAFKPLEIAPPPCPPGEKLLDGTVETRALGVRISGESFLVLRAADGALVYCARVVTPGSASTLGSEVEIVQTVREGALASFEARILSGPRRIVVQGTPTGNTMSIEQRVDGHFVGNFPVRDRLAFVDVGSVTTELALSRRESGAFKVVFFEDLDPGVGNWDMRVEPDGTHLVKTHAGRLIARFAADGTLAASQRDQGRSLATRTTVSARSFGPGLPLPPGKTAFSPKPSGPAVPGAEPR